MLPTCINCNGTGIWDLEPKFVLEAGEHLCAVCGGEGSLSREVLENRIKWFEQQIIEIREYLAKLDTGIQQ
jgi:hypothetical protein